MMKKAFVSTQAPCLEAFLTFKRSLGLRYATSAFYLHEFDLYCADHESDGVSLKEIVKNWIALRENECPNTQRVRVAPIREFGKYLQSSGHTNGFVIQSKICRQQVRSMPHFFTNDEILRFFNACDTLAPRKENRVRHLVLPMYFRLLYCCGVRTCEARLLLRKNVNLQVGYINIIHSKGLKDRRVFLPVDLRSLYLKYDAVVNNIYPDRTYFFSANASRCYECSTISQNFRKVWKAAGFRMHARAYDFRHHFAFATLNRWIEQGTDIHSVLPYLTRYMGHASLESTFYYLHLVPEFFPTFSEKTKALEQLLPEVGDDKEE